MDGSFLFMIAIAWNTLPEAICFFHFSGKLQSAIHNQFAAYQHKVEGLKHFYLILSSLCSRVLLFVNLSTTSRFPPFVVFLHLVVYLRYLTETFATVASPA